MGRRTLRLRPSKPRLLSGVKPPEQKRVSSSPGISGARSGPEILLDHAPSASAPSEGQTIRSVPYQPDLRDFPSRPSNTATHAPVDGIGSTGIDLSGMTVMGVRAGPASASTELSRAKPPGFEHALASSDDIKTPELTHGGWTGAVLEDQETRTPTLRAGRPSSTSPRRPSLCSRRASPRQRQRSPQGKLNPGPDEAFKAGSRIAKTTGSPAFPSGVLHPLHPLRMNPPDATTRPVLAPRMTTSSTMPFPMAGGRAQGQIPLSNTSAHLDSPHNFAANRRPTGPRGLRSSQTMVFPTGRAASSSFARLMKENLRRVSAVLGLRRAPPRASPPQPIPANNDVRVEGDGTAPALQLQKVDSTESRGATTADARHSAKSMVQQMLGKRLMRRNVPAGWKDNQNYPSAICEDPFSEAHHPDLPSERPRTVFEARLRAGSDGGPSLISIPSTDPFESEGVFDTSLSAMLPSEPLGSSTPRALNQVCDASLPDSPTKPPHGLGLSGIHGHAHSENAHRHARSKSEVGPPNSKRVQGSFSNSGMKLGTDAELAFAPVVRRKKHPSPAKIELAILEQQLQILRELATDGISGSYDGDSMNGHMAGGEESVVTSGPASVTSEELSKVADTQPSHSRPALAPVKEESRRNSWASIRNDRDAARLRIVMARVSHKKSNSLSQLPANRNSNSSIVGAFGVRCSSTASAIDSNSCAQSRVVF